MYNVIPTELGFVYQYTQSSETEKKKVKSTTFIQGMLDESDVIWHDKAIGHKKCHCQIRLCSFFSACFEIDFLLSSKLKQTNNQLKYTRTSPLYVECV